MFSVAEDTASGATVGTLSATDPQNDISGYNITAGDDSSLFTLVALPSGNAELRIDGSLDFEETSSYVLTVEVVDVFGNSDTATVTVNVTDVALVVDEAAGHGWEGSDLFFNFRVSGDVSVVVTYDVDIDNDGIYDISDLDHDAMIGGTSIIDVPLSFLLCLPVEQGSYPATVRIVTDGNVVEVPFTIDIENTPPAVDLDSPSTVTAGVAHTWNIEISEPGDDTISSIVVEWGDGSSTTVSGGATSVTHTYLADGDYLADITVTDEDGTYASDVPITVGFVLVVNPAPVYNIIAKYFAGKVTKVYTHAAMLRNIRQDWTVNQVNSGIMKFADTVADPYGYELAAVGRWETKQKTEIGAGFTVEFETKAFVDYLIIGGLLNPDPAKPNYGEVSYTVSVFSKCTVTNNTTGVVTKTMSRIFKSDRNIAKDLTYPNAVPVNPNPERLPTTPDEFDAPY